ncbi:MAG: 16S rRNA (adenine(1518)-N(6)/adenine(1519)-N(6))-dimethyltransferase RsmA [Clostridiales bacterium]|nr:16S rRNA (adenine(1518)-N(6)/adenine(1519)-N(6))-dimethyltransferase RsmA [Clostridiales bacterium]
MTRDVLERHNFTMVKKFGQNFLVDPGVLEGIVEAAEIYPEDLVIEIGPGIGTLTQYLCVAAGQVVAVEIDKLLMPVLEETLRGYHNVEVINEDILKVDIDRIVEEKNEGRPVKIVANLPYYITTPIIMTLLERHIPFESITIMVQKEVADRMQAHPGSKDYGALSLAVQYYADPEVVMSVPPSAFMPRPKVDSSVIKLDAVSEPKVNVSDEKLFFKIVRACFNQRRKTMVNGLKNSEDLSFSKEEIEGAIISIDKPLTVRGETLTLEEFAALTNALGDARTTL